MFSKRCFFVKFLFLLSFLLILTSCGEKESKSRDWSKSDKLIVALNLTIPPFEAMDKDGNPYGISVDLANDLATYMGKTAEIVNVKWEGIVPGIRSGHYDISTSFIPITPDMEEMVDLSNPFGKGGMELVTKKDFHFEDLASLNNSKVRISSRNNSYSQGIVDKYFPEATSIKMSTYDVAFLELLQGKVDVVLSNPITAHAYGEKYKDQLSVRYHSLSALPTGMAMRKTNKKELLKIVNSFLKDYIKSGKMEILADKYMFDLKKEYEKQGQSFEILF